ncbi:hypothetical protein BEH94_11665 [Candidatus Altiarchaeales archaeon WOR_SM1_SCG]|nr:hypothetical protein BEH94_11665 [Candidatus Altiarchaeales archaeon WOR_SM1_SCG]
MKFSKFDIGGEIISILTRGMYPDPRDAIREYIQNCIDADSKEILVKVGQDTVVIQDDGSGMDQKTMRKAVRIGVSDKIPSKDVGFMGIGIYSSFHLCDKLTIYSNQDDSPNKLEIDFNGMRELLDAEKSLRLDSKISSEELTDLQTLLETHLFVSEDGDVKPEEFPHKGTRVELTGLKPAFYTEISDFNKLSEYIQEVVPLRFDKENFRWGELIENKITEICEREGAKFERVDVNLQVHNKSKYLYKPYKNSDFKNDSPQEPRFHEIKYQNKFFGVAWGCLNSIRRKINNKDLRGFLLKKQGFGIGKRQNLMKYFPEGHQYFDRYIGEVIIVNKELLPNASRSDLEHSALRALFYDAFRKVAAEYDGHGFKFQKQDLAEEKLSEIKGELQQENLRFNESEENAEKLIDQVVKVKKISDNIDIRLKDSKYIKPEDKKLADELKKQAKSLEYSIQNKIHDISRKTISQRKKTKAKKRKGETPIERAKKLSGIDLPKIETKKYETLVEVFEDLDIELSEEIRKALYIIDEKFIQSQAENKEHYFQLLNELKDQITD